MLCELFKLAVCAGFSFEVEVATGELEALQNHRKQYIYNGFERGRACKRQIEAPDFKLSSQTSS